jgi:DNA-binding helix-hairpin-helix protein with protein kinase domain
MIRKHSVDRVKRDARLRALEKHLQSVWIRNLRVQGLGKVKLETLVRHGVHTVADLRRERLEGLPLIGESMIQRLLDARAHTESAFQFIRSAAVAAKIEAKVASEIHSCTAAIRRQIVGLEANAKSIKQEYARQMHGLQESHQALVLNQMILQREAE